MPKTGLSAQALRERAIEVAAEAIRRYGIDRVRLADVARDLGVSHVALYKHFAGKTELFDGVSETWIATLDRKLEHAASSPRRSATRRIHDVFVTMHRVKRERVQRDPELYRAFFGASERRAPFILRHLATLERVVQSLVKEAQRDGEIGPGNATTIAAVLTEAMMPFTHPALVAQFAEQEREASLHRVLDVVLRGLR